MPANPKTGKPPSGRDKSGAKRAPNAYRGPVPANQKSAARAAAITGAGAPAPTRTKRSMGQPPMGRAKDGTLRAPNAYRGPVPANQRAAARKKPR